MDKIILWGSDEGENLFVKMEGGSFVFVSQEFHLSGLNTSLRNRILLSLSPEVMKRLIDWSESSGNLADSNQVHIEGVRA